jgi:hypothetical protein
MLFNSKDIPLVFNVEKRIVSSWDPNQGFIDEI